MRKTHHLKIDFEAKALFKVVCALALVVLSLKLHNFILVFLLGVMLAVAFEPVVARLSRLGLNRKLGIALVAVTAVSCFVLFSYIIIPSIYEQLSALVKDLPEIRDKFLNKIPDSSLLKKSLKEAMNGPRTLELSAVASKAFPYLNIGLEAFAEMVLIFILSIYLLIEGAQAFNWFSNFFGASTRIKLRQTAKEIAPIVHHYILGQIITSVASAIYTFVVLSLLHVPAALTLAGLAGILDVLPVLGFILAVIPAVLLGLTVSPLTALLVLAAYILYHAIENYFLMPLVYGNRLKLSSLVVLGSLIVAGSVSGILGAITILPIVAAFPIMEEIWLIPYLGRAVVEKHARETDPKLNNSGSMKDL